MLRLLGTALLALLAAAAPAQAIVSGTQAKEGDFPFLARLNGVPCTGTLISPTQVLTAAHCVQGASPEDLGAITIGGKRATRKAVSVVSDPRYVAVSAARPLGAKEPTARHDVALVTLDAAVTSVAPVPLLRAGERARAGSALTVVGKGSTQTGTFEQSRTLQRATLELLSDGRCSSIFRTTSDRESRGRFAAADELCADDPGRRRGRSGRGVCGGDSGGPALVRLRSGKLRQVGVVSWVLGSCGDGPTVFTDVSEARKLLAAPPAAAPVPPAIPASLTGEPRVGATLTCTSPAPAASVRWFRYRDGKGQTFVVEAPGSTYVVRPADAGFIVRCEPRLRTAGGFAFAGLGALRIGQ